MQSGVEAAVLLYQVGINNLHGLINHQIDLNALYHVLKLQNVARFVQSRHVGLEFVPTFWARFIFIALNQHFFHGIKQFLVG